MRIVVDCTQETLYPLAKEGFSGGSQVYVKAIIRGLVSKGHTVHVIAPDLEGDEQRGEHEWWWPKDVHPTRFDVAIQQMHLRTDPDYDAPILILMTSCVDPQLGPDNKFGGQVDAFPVFSDVHKQLLLKMRPTVSAEKCYITGLGVDLTDYQREPLAEMARVGLSFADDVRDRVCEAYKIPGRMLYANDPARGLFYTLDVFDAVKREVPEATLHVAYDFDKQLSWRAWEHSQMAQMLHECKARMASTPGVVNLGGLDRADIIREQLECQVHCYPSDPPGIGTQTHGLMQAECAAAGCALVLSDVEAFPEIFGAGAEILPTIGTFLPDQERRVTADDYAAVVIDLMRDSEKWEVASRKARALAETMSWQAVVDRWEEMLTNLREGVAVA